jgi:hypothetical protein
MLFTCQRKWILNQEKKNLAKEGENKNKNS